MPDQSDQPPHPHRRPQHAQTDQLAPHDPFHMMEFKLALIDTKLDAVHRGELVMLRSLASCFPDRQLISPENFITQVAWLGDQAHSSGGGSTSARAQTRAHVMQEDETNEEEDDAEIEVNDDEEKDESDEDDASDDSVS